MFATGEVTLSLESTLAISKLLLELVCVYWSQVDTVQDQSEWQQGMLSEYDQLTNWSGR